MASYHSEGMRAPARAKLKGFENAETRRMAFVNLFQHMYEISDDPSDSDPRAYLNERDATTIEQFVELANAVGWAGSSPLGMRTARIKNFPAWRSPRRTVKASLTKTLFYPNRIVPRRAYIFAHLLLDPSQPVAITDKGRLVSERGTELVRSKGIGWGRLPDRRLWEPAINEDFDEEKFDPETPFPAIRYGRGPLHKILMSQIPAKALREAGL